MGASQEEPPWPDSGFTPRMMQWVKPFIEYVRGQRVVDGDGISWMDAPGGGKLPIADSPAATRRFLCNLGGRLAYGYVPFRLDKYADEDP